LEDEDGERRKGREKTSIRRRIEVRKKNINNKREIRKGRSRGERANNVADVGKGRCKTGED
jgi:hypothetical protein